MDFPDKIYAYFSFPKISCHLRSRMWCIDPVGPGENIEYIRKDALLEWAKEQATITEKLNGKGAMLKAWDSLIDKIESL